MSEQRQPASPTNIKAYARLGGLLYLIIIVIGLVGESVIRGKLVVSGDPEATARAILAAEWLWRLGVGGQDLLLLCAVGLTLIWYVLLRPVNPHLAMAVAFFGLVSLAVESVGALHLHAVLTPLSGSAYLKVIDPQQLHLLAYQSVVAHAHAFGLALIFFGVECLIVGHLIRKSGYIPKAIGWLMQLAGVCYLVNSFAMILYPPLQDMLFPVILLPSFIGESAFCLYLLIKGADVPAWRRLAGEAASAV
ncbi:DUF4386 domain-containing protein [Burkholderia sp. LMU1-1-1.1]|uniref:DUF4386 domain-containing protein n=1 Tax=Burkholderia sp. LMU1-1-1.1 TaxID=3135266 RepID=UPI00342D66FB